MSDDDAVREGLQTIASNLAWYMREQGWTEDTLATASGLSKRTISNFLRPGNRKPGRNSYVPSGTLANLVRIEAALGFGEADSLLRPVVRHSDEFHDAVEAAYIERRDAELSGDVPK
jgi:transcriptional regulator with XRE-family HTH domain